MEIEAMGFAQEAKSLGRRLASGVIYAELNNSRLYSIAIDRPQRN